MDWLDITKFDGLDLSESYVLGWLRKDNQMTFQADFAVAPDHPTYSPPLPTEYAHFRLGTLSFSNVKSAKGLPDQSAVRPAIDASGEADYGHIESFTRNVGVCEIGLEFGIVNIEAESLLILLPK